MEITPNDIKAREFARVMRGFDATEVSAFLEQVADEYAALIKNRNEMERQLQDLEKELKGYRDLDRNIRDSLVNAQGSAGTIREDARKEAELIVREAEVKAEELITSTRSRLEGMKNDLEMLRLERKAYLKKFRHLIDSQLELLEVLAGEVQDD
jgi:cell division initiation protein